MPALHGMAHITGGGIEGNLNRILPDGLDAAITLDRVRVLPVFRLIRDMGNVDERDMLRTFNMGVGMTLVVEASAAEQVRRHLSGQGCESYPIGRITKGLKQVVYEGKLNW